MKNYKNIEIDQNKNYILPLIKINNISSNTSYFFKNIIVKIDSSFKMYKNKKEIKTFDEYIQNFLMDNSLLSFEIKDNKEIMKINVNNKVLTIIKKENVYNINNEIEITIKEN